MATAPAGTPNSRSTIRAIPSTIVSRSAPTVPAASQTFEPLIRQALGARLTKLVLVPSAGCVWVGSILWSSWYEGAGFGQLVSSFLSPTAFAYAMLVWASTVLPSVVLRKLCSTADRHPTASPLQTIKSALTKRSTFLTLLIHLASSFAIAILHVLRAYMSEAGDPKLALFVKSRKHPFYLNGRLLFLFCSQISVTVVFAFRVILFERFSLRKPSRPTPTLRTPFTAPEIAVTLAVGSILAAASLILGMLVFAEMRLLLPVFYHVPLLSSLIKPFTYHFLRGSYTLILPFRHVPLLARAWTLGCITLFSWELSDMLFSNAIPQPIPTPSIDPVPVVSGLSSADPTFSRFAYYSLEELASSSAPGRAQIFSDQRFHPSLWSTLLRSCLLTLGKDYQLLLRRGKPLPPSVPTIAPKPAPSSAPIGTPKKLIRSAIFRDSTHSVPEKEEVVEEALDAVAADGPLSHAVDALPELFKSHSGPVAKVVPQALKAPPVPSPPSVNRLSEIWAQAKARALAAVPIPKAVEEVYKMEKEWLQRERPSRVVDSCVPRREIDALAISILANLTCASLTEDRLGVVQRDIPKILEAFISHLVAVEEYKGELQSWPMNSERLKGEEMLVELEDALREGIGMIVRTFGEKLSAFRLPARIATKLETFVDYAA